MTPLEIILWIVTGIIISEAIFISWTIWYGKKEDKYSKTFDWSNYPLSESWIVRKLFSFFLGGAITMIQLGIVCGFEGLETHYEYILYESSILLILGLFFVVNYAINKKIIKDEGKKK